MDRTTEESKARQRQYQARRASIGALDAMLLPHVHTAIRQACASRTPQPLPAEDRLLLVAETPFRLAAIVAAQPLGRGQKVMHMIDAVLVAYERGILGKPVPAKEVEREMLANAARLACDIRSAWIDVIAVIPGLAAETSMTAEDLAAGRFDAEFFPENHSWLREMFLHALARKRVTDGDLALAALRLLRASRPAATVFPPEGMPLLRWRVDAKRKKLHGEKP